MLSRSKTGLEVCAQMGKTLVKVAYLRDARV